jgi:hypothetical protein
MQYNLRLGGRDQVAFVGNVPNLLTVVAKNCGALEEQVTIASASITRIFLCLFLAIGQIL